MTDPFEDQKGSVEESHRSLGREMVFAKLVSTDRPIATSSGK
jgi:hypothetical protein